MANSNPSFKFTSKVAKKAGKKSKRKKLDVQLLEAAQKLTTEKGKKITLEAKINKVLVTEASKGKLPFIKEFYDRVAGKPPQSHSIDGGIPVDIPDATLTIKEEERIKNQLDIVFGRHSKKKKGK